MSKSKKVSNSKYKSSKCPTAAQVGLSSCALVLGGLAYTGVSSAATALKTAATVGVTGLKTVGSGLSAAKGAVGTAASLAASGVYEGVVSLLSNKATDPQEKPDLQFAPPAFSGKGCSKAVNASNPCEPLTLEQGLGIGGGVAALAVLGYCIYKCSKNRTPTPVVVPAETDSEASGSDLESGYKSVASTP